MYVSLCLCVFVCMCVYGCLCVCKVVYVCVWVFMGVYVCVYVCMFVSVRRIETSIVWVKCPEIGLVAGETFLGFAGSLRLTRSFFRIMFLRN
jgi:hypothetical protein